MHIDGIDRRRHHIEDIRDARTAALGGVGVALLLLLPVLSFLLADDSDSNQGEAFFLTAVSAVSLILALALLLMVLVAARAVAAKSGKVPFVPYVYTASSLWFPLRLRRFPRDGSVATSMVVAPRSGAGTWTMDVGGMLFRVQVGSGVITHRDVRAIRADVARVNAVLAGDEAAMGAESVHDSSAPGPDDAEIAALIDRVVAGEVSALPTLAAFDDADIVRVGDSRLTPIAVRVAGVKYVLESVLDGTIALLEAGGWARFISLGAVPRPLEETSFDDGSFVIGHEAGRSDEIIEGLSLMQVVNWDDDGSDPLDDVRREHIEAYLDHLRGNLAVAGEAVSAPEAWVRVRDALRRDSALGPAFIALDSPDSALLIKDPESGGLDALDEREELAASATDVALTEALRGLASGPLTVIADHGVSVVERPRGTGAALVGDRALTWGSLHVSGVGAEILSHSSGTSSLRAGLVCTGAAAELGLVSGAALDRDAFERLAAATVAVVAPAYQGESYLVLNHGRA
ncbi:hypothetical protein [Demequina sp. NBRC 110054]|uniref:hypothetical protein n=1 Tax=Demequina sp. NBRC 110054 TaxID=1570343 RepID=UPI0011774C33|nr:hypothetical protein [Demequina sp. NBRC 110054]